MAVENLEKSAMEHAICAANTKMERSENFSAIVFPFHSTVLISHSIFYVHFIFWEMLRWRCPCKKILQRCSSNVLPADEILKPAAVREQDVPIEALRNLPKFRVQNFDRKGCFTVSPSFSKGLFHCFTVSPLFWEQLFHCFAVSRWNCFTCFTCFTRLFFLSNSNFFSTIFTS